ncbi:MAG: alpha/beta hydrolase [Acidobacteria bacterium]|nr:alpha/beta hydrolase [Acidobacteriota bacterium]
MLLRLFGFWTHFMLRLRGVRRETCHAAGFDVRLYHHGAPEAEPWLLLHGLGSTALTWCRTISTLSGNCRLWVPELSALGGTTGPSPGMNVRQATAAMAALIRQHSPGRPVTVCGISLGGWVGVRLALDHSELVERLVLINSGGWRDQDWGAVGRLVRVDGIAGVERLYRALFRRVPLVLRFSKRGFLAAYTSPAVRHILGTLSEDDAFDENDLARIRCPVAVIWGAHDGIFPLAIGERIAAALPQGDLTVISEAAHGVHWELPGRMNEAIDDFRRQHPVEQQW